LYLSDNLQLSVVASHYWRYCRHAHPQAPVIDSGFDGPYLSPRFKQYVAPSPVCLRSAGTTRLAVFV